jgi:hypothetical protein
MNEKTRIIYQKQNKLTVKQSKSWHNFYLNFHNCKLIGIRYSISLVSKTIHRQGIEFDQVLPNVA